MFYAQLNSDDIVFSVSMLYGEVNTPNMVRLTDAQWELQPLGWRYDREKQEFIIPEEVK